ncbi:hypothetical protein PENTCL1PPCAC_23581 [Pristionchus entomophagus]|uniref:Uncharacterized protein n=1 Tax=Pristionchus entomophagus TaxID=358040 RepID=A0AAV5U4U7_9BILA|nr:hypothetical protein PENTCL1PPCAC_23581 [Pristionchus entomophagus]
MLLALILFLLIPAISSQPEVASPLSGPRGLFGRANSLFDPVFDSPKIKLPEAVPALDLPKIDTKAYDENPLMPSRGVVENTLLSLMDGLIKSGQIELAKSAFKTQLDVIKKIRPEQYDKYKKMGVESMAADAVMKQAEVAAQAPRSGNRFIDMLSDNGIPIGSSIKGVEDALRTQRQLDATDPSDQIAKAVFEKFQTQILPGIVANLVAGRNPFKVPPHGPGGAGGLRPMTPTSEIGSHRIEARGQQAMSQNQRLPYPQDTSVDHEMRRSPSAAYHRDTVIDSSLYARLSSSPRLSALLRDERVLSAISHSRRMRDEPIDDMPSGHGLDSKSNLLLGLFEGDEEDESDADKLEIRRAPSSADSATPLYTIRSSLMAALAQKPEVRRALSKLRVRSDRVDELLRPKPFPFPSDHKNAGFMKPREIPKRPRKMLPLIIGANRKEFLRRAPQKGVDHVTYRSRVIDNMMNNPNIAPLFMDDSLMHKLVGRPMLSDVDKGRVRRRILVTHPRFASNGGGKEDERVVQTVEERAVPGLFEMPKGRHTRIRWTGARESEVPGVGGRFIIPSFDPTRPALNTAISTQGRFRDEWDTTWKVPNTWQPGDEVRFSMKQKTQRFIGGDGNADMPAAGY